MKNLTAALVGTTAAISITVGIATEVHAQGKSRPGTVGSALAPAPPPRRPTTWYYVPQSASTQASLTNISGEGGTDGTQQTYGLNRFTAKWKATNRNWNNDSNYFKVDPPKVALLAFVIGREQGDKPLDLEFGFYNAHLWDNENDRGQTKFGTWQPLYTRATSLQGLPNWTTTLFEVSGTKAEHPFDFLRDGQRGNQSSAKVAWTAGFIHGLAVCLNNNETRLKGVRVYGSTLQPDGTFRRDPALQDETFKRSNCSKWQTPQLCPAGELVVGVNVRSSDDGVVGLALQCMQVKRNTVPEGYLDAPEGQRRVARPGL